MAAAKQTSKRSGNGPLKSSTKAGLVAHALVIGKRHGKAKKNGEIRGNRNSVNGVHAKHNGEAAKPAGSNRKLTGKLTGKGVAKPARNGKPAKEAKPANNGKSAVVAKKQPNGKTPKTGKAASRAQPVAKANGRGRAKPIAGKTNGGVQFDGKHASGKLNGDKAGSKAGSTARSEPKHANTKTNQKPTSQNLTKERGPLEKHANGVTSAEKPAVNGHATLLQRGENRRIELPADYRPAENEPFMNERQRTYFKQKLMNWREEILLQNRETLLSLHEESSQHADLADRATSETDRALELRARDRQRKLVSKINSALARIEDRSYGYCAETGEPIGLKRLDARPIATLTVEAQERHERREKEYKDE